MLDDQYRTGEKRPVQDILRRRSEEWVPAIGSDTDLESTSHKGNDTRCGRHHVGYIGKEIGPCLRESPLFEGYNTCGGIEGQVCSVLAAVWLGEEEQEEEL
ncbi:hypothetical protein MAP00_006749 [Monascus purpureus]|nr:hypothetical protein MAP00_006749 [Monascus purpureus]